MEVTSNRRQTDRRNSPMFFNKYQLGFSGRRIAGRRTSEGAAYVDQYNMSVAFVAIGIVCLSALDAAFTLKLLSLGAIEINAVMALLIEHDAYSFVTYKLGLTICSVLLLVIHNEVKLRIGVTVYHVAQGLFALYVALIAYELMLFRMILG